MKLSGVFRNVRKTSSVLLILLAGSIIAFYSQQAWAEHGIISSCVSDINCPKEDVVNTKHNFAHNRDIVAQGTTEICVFCHTPHGGNTSLPGGAPAGTAPLWNRMLPEGSKYTPYSSPNFDLAGTNPGQPKGVSLACLSCHDGTIALDALINAPGSGGYFGSNSGQGAGPGTHALQTNGDFSNWGPFIDANGTLSEDPNSVSAETPTGRPPVPFPNLGTDLSDDHPIGMEIPASDPQFDRVRASVDLDGGVEGTSVWYAKGRGGQFSPDKRDRVRFYPSTGTSAMYVECASCHNPHTPRPVFLRLPTLPDGTGNLAPATKPNQQSALCLTCHDK